MRAALSCGTVDDFLNGKKNIVISNSSEIELKAGKLPDETQIMVLKPALLIGYN